jgi:hypothetical protein
VVFALVSLCLAVVPIAYFINHRYDGLQLWNVQGVPGVHSAVWAVSFLSFFFLYPSTFNILEVTGGVGGYELRGGLVGGVSRGLTDTGAAGFWRGWLKVGLHAPPHLIIMGYRWTTMSACDR